MLVALIGFGSCSGNEKTLIKFPCSPEVSVVQRFKKGSLVTESSYRNWLVVGGQETPISTDEFRGYTPPSIPRTVLGDPIRTERPWWVQNLYLNSLEQTDVAAVAQCFEKNYSAFESAYKASDSAEFLAARDVPTTFVLWRATFKDLRPEFVSASGTYLYVASSGTIYHVTRTDDDKKKLKEVGEVLFDQSNATGIELKLEGVSELTPEAFLHDGKTMRQFYLPTKKKSTNPKTN